MTAKSPLKQNPTPLFVDLDGTLIKSDLVYESILLLLKQNLLMVIFFPLWLSKGRAFFKQQLAKRIDVPLQLLPLNPEFKAYLDEQAIRKRHLTLISAASDEEVQRVSKYIGLFTDAIGSDGRTNLKGRNRLNRIKQLCGNSGFAYAGNSAEDIGIWNEADEILLVSCSESVDSNIENASARRSRFDRPHPYARMFLKAMRPHQWLKNSLIFLPLVLSHQLGRLDLLAMATLAFISFSLCASSVYLLNDLLDLNNDRRHESKRDRPLAAGTLPLVIGFLGAPVLLLISVAVGLLLPPDFLVVLAFYWCLTCLYSFYLKRIVIVDVITLAFLYTLRIVAGSAAISATTTIWLLSFSVFVFLSLALVKRYTELVKILARGETQSIGRAYRTQNLKLILQTGGVSSAISVIVFIFYINAPSTTKLYENPVILWLICPLLIYLLVRIWSYARRGVLNEDPILFAITDRKSQVLTLFCGLLIWLAI